jgi:hypothetical protein
MVSVDAVFNSGWATSHSDDVWWPEFPREGGLASYGPDLAEQYRLSGVYVGRILKGAKTSSSSGHTAN